MFYDSLGFLEDQYFNLNGANAVFCLVRILSYLRINPNISQLTDTFTRCVLLGFVWCVYTGFLRHLFSARIKLRGSYD